MTTPIPGTVRVWLQTDAFVDVSRDEADNVTGALQMPGGAIIAVTNARTGAGELIPSWSIVRVTVPASPDVEQPLDGAPPVPTVGNRQAAYDAVYAVIREHPPVSASDYDQAAENARVWRAVQAALDALVAETRALMDRRNHDQEA
jgi:hypothetical protein